MLSEFWRFNNAHILGNFDVKKFFPDVKIIQVHYLIWDRRGFHTKYNNLAQILSDQ